MSFTNKSGSIEVTTLARKLLRITFSEDVIVNDDLKDINNYVITPITAGADAVSTVAVYGYNTSFAENSTETLTVDIEITKTTLDAEYALSVNNIKTSESNVLIDLETKFVGRYAKFDSLSKTLPRMYTNKLNGVLSHVLLAVSLGDEVIGGQGDFDYSSVTVAIYQTLGSASIGTSTIGG